MGIKQKFFALAGVVGLIMAIVSIVGYSLAYSQLSASTESDITATMTASANKLDGWLEGKKQVALTTTNLLSKAATADSSVEELRKLLSTTGDDINEVSDITIGTADGKIVSYHAGNLAPKLSPYTMRFYNETKASGTYEFMDTYVDKITGKLVVSVAAPYKNADGSFGGAICEDIFLDVLQDEVKELKYDGQGTGYIIDNAGVVMASEDSESVGKNVSDLPVFADNFTQMTQKGTGYLQLKQNGENQVFAYATVPNTKWLVGVMVPDDVVFGHLSTLKHLYLILTIVSILLIMFACLRFSQGITRRILRLRNYAAQFAEGDMSAEDLFIESQDEIGQLSQVFNQMKNHVRDLLKNITDTSSQLAASSEELTASAQQSAQAATNVAQSVTDVATGVSQQAKNVDTATNTVDNVVTNIRNVATSTENIRSMSVETAQAAQHGQELMGQAVDRMGHIEQSVGKSTEVVTKLGESSQQIGEIIETIVGIADQTNLLALNAAIEAARAGEQGRGFSVVADEVRKLAEQSQAAAEKIRTRIMAIQNDTDEAVQVMQQGTEEVRNGAQAIREVGEEFQRIMSQIDTIRDRMDEMNHSIQTVAEGGDTIAQAVQDIDTVSRKTEEQTEQISAATEEQSASNEEIAAASQALAKLASDMQNITAKFKV